MQGFAAVVGCVALASIATLAQNAPAPAPSQAPKVIQFDPPPDKDGVLSDTQGVDFKPYMAQVSRITQTSWKPLMPREVEPPVRKYGVVVIRFKIQPDGKVEEGGMVLEARSGDPALDRAAWGAIATSVYRPLPKEFTGPNLEVRFRFQYNPDRMPAPPGKAPKARGSYNPLGLTLGYTSREWH